MLKKRLFVLVLLAIIVICCGIIGYKTSKNAATGKKVYPKVPLTVSIDWELSKPIELKIFYTTDQAENFNEKHTVKKDVTPEDKHVEVVIPEDKIYKFRIDFGSNPEKVLLKNVEIIADQYINFNDWESYVYRNIEKVKIHKKENTVTLISTHRDPYMSWIHPFVLYKNE